ncbi:MAG: U32 family peptidase [Methanobrevibacter arboriphilus]|uniref:U32 family peptidase n=1 Tax=Methanobrevibacter arboriphilus TaxID=39441 RepID=A0A843AFM5_METAZ|nr:U32 family peptidase [Methanobrevibacter arboriphilus]MBF4468581.1 U32 family peptidase [Methanobrevibacter arboriphilus]
MVELLSPAGSFISLRAALENGADSVYIGLADNNMRANVSNFSLKNVEEAVDMVKEYSSKLYLCTNTIMKDEDIKKLEFDLELIKEYEVDALIVSDIGLAQLAHDVGIDPHMSVQENVSNIYALKTLKKLGVTRAILSRELNIWEIQDIAKNSPIETEIFIHGAMCMAVSGRCFLSYGLYGKSANCGECLQPCRKDWKLSIAQDEDSDFFYEDDEDSSFILKTSKSNPLDYPLDNGNDIYNKNTISSINSITPKTSFISPNDMAMIDYIPQLIATGVDAFKIEGRARGPDYVATTTRVYREAIDSIENGSFIFKDSWMEDLKKVFNRGFDTGFYFDIPYEISTQNRSEYTKKDIAKVVNYYSKIGVAELQLWDDLAIGDEILIQGKTTGSITQKIESMEINGKFVEYCKKGNNVAVAIDEKVRPNDFVYKLIKRDFTE